MGRDQSPGAKRIFLSSDRTARLFRGEAHDSGAVAGENRREWINADSLRWLIDAACAGRKIIV
jgi:hypothetical protein